MEEIMQSNSFFIIPLTLAYLSICGLWFILNTYFKSWKIESIETSNHPWLDLILGLAACVAIMGVGQLYSAGYLLPQTNHLPSMKVLIWPLNNVIIFSPLFILLMIRRQSLKTVFISKNGIWMKLGFGCVASILGTVVFIAIRGEWYRFYEILIHAIQIDTLSNFPAIFFENVALAFLFVRLKWAVGIKWAIGLPSILFALAHVPGSVAEGDPIVHIITFFFLTGSLTTVILYTAYRSRDILWLGVVHYIMDVVIKAF